MTLGAIIEGGEWLPVSRTNPQLVGLYLRHYSASKNVPEGDYQARHRRYQHGFAGNGSDQSLLTVNGTAGFVWLYNSVERLDHQKGIMCTFFRNEGEYLSSDLVREADEIAWRRWPDHPRHFTYVWDEKVRSVNPGFCYKQAGWKTCGRNKDGRLTILEITQP